MGILRFLFGGSKPSARGRMPTVPFDKKRVTPAVKEHLRWNLADTQELRQLSASDFNRVYRTAVASVERGRDLAMLSKTLQKIAGVPQHRAGEIAHHLHNHATAIMNTDRQQSLGITHAIWMYSGAPCSPHPSHATAAQKRQDAAHQKANGRQFEISRGLKLNGQWVKPGEAEWCKCSYRSIIPGIK